MSVRLAELRKKKPLFREDLEARDVGQEDDDRGQRCRIGESGLTVVSALRKASSPDTSSASAATTNSAAMERSGQRSNAGDERARLAIRADDCVDSKQTDDCRSGQRPEAELGNRHN